MKKPRRTKFQQIRCTEMEKKMIREVADAMGTSVTDIIMTHFEKLSKRLDISKQKTPNAL